SNLSPSGKAVARAKTNVGASCLAERGGSSTVRGAWRRHCGAASSMYYTQRRCSQFRGICGGKMAFDFIPFSITIRRRFVSILLAVAIFAPLTWLESLARDRPVELAISNALLVGVGVGIFEEFYVQNQRGRWLRNMHPLRSVLVYASVVAAIYLVATHLSHLILGRWGDLPNTYRGFPIVIPFFLGSAIIGIAVMRIVHFIGVETLFHLMVGTYHRPVLQDKVLVFVDINGSTAMAERLGPLETRSLIGKFLFDISKPIIDHGGEIYVYKGDGLIALWGWNRAIRQNTLLRAVDAMFAAAGRE